MKKKLLHIFLVCGVFLLLAGGFTMAASAAGRNVHSCSQGFEPIISVNLDTIALLGCSSCDKNFYPNYPSVSISLENGAVLDADDYTIPYKDVLDCTELLKKSGNEIIFLYVGREKTVYPLSETKPTEPGDYSVCLSTRKQYDYYQETHSSNYEQAGFGTQTYVTGVMTYRTDFTLVHNHEFTYSADGEKLCVKCTKCSAYGEISLDVEADFCVGHFEKSDVPVVYTDWAEYSEDDAVLLYEGREDKKTKEVTEYALTDEMPGEAGIYTVSLALKSAWETGDVQYRTDPIPFTIDDECHKWTYTADGCSVVAECKSCDATARVVLDASAVYENARQLDADGLQQELFYAEDWSSYKDIAPFTILYDGKEVYDLENGSAGKVGTTRLYSSIIPPTGAGNYVAYVAILKNATDVSADSIIVKSAGMPFYVAGYSFKRCEVLEYGKNEIALFTEPISVNNTYYVGTQSELLWCVYNQTSDMKIVLTNDIVVNPITVTESGNISTGALVVYKWQGFGYKDAPFTGTIDGNGYTIYGLYMPEARSGDNVAGFICWGRNVTIKNLTIESSYLKAGNAAGAFAGAIVDISGETSITNCNSLHNLVQSDTEAGGFVGWISGNRSALDEAYLKMQDCINDSFVKAACAGGIIGRTDKDDYSLCEGILDQCYNYGSITGTDYAAGIIGSMTVWHHLGFGVTNCLNDGDIRANTYESGIVCEINTNGNGGAMVKNCIDVSGNVNIGDLYFRCKNVYDIVGKTGNNDYCQIGLLKLEDNYFCEAKSAYPSTLTEAPKATKLTNKNIQDGKVCEILGHVESAHYGDVTVAGCETGGEKHLLCATCGEVLEIITTSPHGHIYDSLGECLYCNNETESENVASLFSTGAWIASVVVIVLMIGAAAAVVVVKKKKNAATAKDAE